MFGCGACDKQPDNKNVGVRSQSSVNRSCSACLTPRFLRQEILRDQAGSVWAEGLRIQGLRLGIILEMRVPLLG